MWVRVAKINLFSLFAGSIIYVEMELLFMIISKFGKKQYYESFECKTNTKT